MSNFFDDAAKPLSVMTIFPSLNDTARELLTERLERTLTAIDRLEQLFRAELAHLDRIDMELETDRAYANELRSALGETVTPVA